MIYVDSSIDFRWGDEKKTKIQPVHLIRSVGGQKTHGGSTELVYIYLHEWLIFKEHVGEYTKGLY